MTRNGVLQKLAVGVVFGLIGAVFYYFGVLDIFSPDPFRFYPSIPKVGGGSIALAIASLLFWAAFKNWRTKVAFEETFAVELPSWKRDVSGVQAAKREAAQKAVANVLREANNDFFFHAIQESGAVQRILSLHKDSGEKKTTDEKKKEINVHRSLVAVIQEKRRSFFKFRDLVKKCGIRIPKEFEHLVKIELTIELPVEAKR